MLKVNILTLQLPLKRGFNIYYPLIKWEHHFKKEGISFKYFNSHKTKSILEGDVIIIDYRYYFSLIRDKLFLNNTFIIDFIILAKSHGLTVILFDTSDSTGSRSFDVTPFVDLHLKKQLHRNHDFYTVDNGDRSVRCWLPEETKVSESEVEYIPCKPDQLHKLKVGWNIGMVDYRTFPFAKFLPFGTSKFLNNIYKLPKSHLPATNRRLITTFRGNLHNNIAYSYQRNLALVALQNLQDSNIALGKPISKSKYYRELASSKAIVSPYGWGEICYRDFEAFIFGNLLLKPDMGHLTTYPNMFIENETYIPLKWDLSDLKEKIYQLRYQNTEDIATNAQNRFLEATSDSKSFINHFNNTLSYLG